MGRVKKEMTEDGVSSQGYVNPTFVTTPEDDEIPATPQEEELVSGPISTTEKKTSTKRTEHDKVEAKDVELKENKSQGSPRNRNQVTFTSLVL